MVLVFVNRSKDASVDNCQGVAVVTDHAEADRRAADLRAAGCDVEVLAGDLPQNLLDNVFVKGQRSSSLSECAASDSLHIDQLGRERID